MIQDCCWLNRKATCKCSGWNCSHVYPTLYIQFLKIKFIFKMMKLCSFSISKRWLIPNPNLIFLLFGWGKGQGEGKEGRSDRNVFQKESFPMNNCTTHGSEEKAPYFMQKKKERMVVIKTQHRLVGTCCCLSRIFNHLFWLP